MLSGASLSVVINSEIIERFSLERDAADSFSCLCRKMHSSAVTLETQKHERLVAMNARLADSRLFFTQALDKMCREAAAKNYTLEETSLHADAIYLKIYNAQRETISLLRTEIERSRLSNSILNEPLIPPTDSHSHTCAFSQVAELMQKSSEASCQESATNWTARLCAERSESEKLRRERDALLESLADLRASSRCCHEGRGLVHREIMSLRPN